jgi:hypothetical protein
MFRGLKDALLYILEGMADVESSVLNIFNLRYKASCQLIPDSIRLSACVREKCLQAEKAEGEAPIQWRTRGPPPSRAPVGRPRPQKIPTKAPVQPNSRYVSKFKNNESAVEDKILNQVILNKLNKFSAANYDDIKSFLQQILDSDENEFLQSFMILVFKKAASEPTYCSLYARMIGELSVEYKTLRNELETLYNSYLTIFEEVTEDQTKDYEAFVQRNREKFHRLGYSQFLAELTSLGILEQEQLEKLYTTILNQIIIHAVVGEEKQQLIDEYIDCLLRMTRAFQKKQLPILVQIRQGLAKVCEGPMTDILSKRSTLYPGITKKAGFALMDCLDIFRGSI